MADFKKLGVWQKARELAVNTIQACDEMAGATASIVRNQLVRAVMSVPSNIAEGSAKKSDREFARFLRISLGSATEAENHLIIATDLHLLDETTFEKLNKQVEDVRKNADRFGKAIDVRCGKAISAPHVVVLQVAGSR